MVLTRSGNKTFALRKSNVLLSLLLINRFSNFFLVNLENGEKTDCETLEIESQCEKDIDYASRLIGVDRLLLFAIRAIN